VVVHQAPHTLYLKDTDGDDKADVRKVLFTGWSTSDTHAGPSNLHYGFDNWLYGMVGYAGFEGRVGGERQSFRTGFYRFLPDGSKMEFLRNTNNNSWGVGFSEEGILFGSTANNNPSVYLPIPNRYYESVRGWSARALGGIAVDSYFHPITEKIRQVDHHGKFTAAAGHALYTARTYPPIYWNKTAFVTDPTGHLAATFELQPSGADFVARYGWNLLASDDEWCAPVMAEVGPDGNVWVIDWYNFIVQHNPTPIGYKTGRGAAYETELRDKKHGRIYRIVPRNASASKPFSLAGATPEKLVATLKNDNLFWRRHAQRLLVERGNKDVVPELLKLAGDTSLDGIGLNVGAIHALWTLHGLAALDGNDAKPTAAAISALKHPSAGVRRNALGVLPRTEEGLRAVLEARLLNDPEPQVKLAALLALAEMPPSPKAGQAVSEFLSVAQHRDDRWLREAATSAAARHDLGFLEAVASAKEPVPEMRRVVALVAQHHALGGSPGSVPRLIGLLHSADPAVAAVIVEALGENWPKGKPVTLDAARGKQLGELFVRVSPSSRGGLLRLASAWGITALDKHAGEVVRSLLATLNDEKQAEEQRMTAARQVVQFQPNNEKVAAALLDAINPRTPPNLTQALLDALGSSRVATVPGTLVEKLGSWTPAAQQGAYRVLLARPESTKVLLAGAEKGAVRLSDLSLDQKQGLLAHPDTKVAELARKLLSRGGDLPNPDRQKVIDELMPLTKQTGNAGLGKAVFTKHCATCHMHSGEGQKIGPDLTGMATHPKAELLVHIMDPSRSVEGNYRMYTVETEDGRVVQGLLSSETKTAIEIIDAQAKPHVVQRNNISTLTPSNRSLMPDGFEKQLTKDDLVNLLEFLTQRGRYLPLPLDKVATVCSVKGMFYSEESPVERLVFRDWSPKVFKGVPFVLTDPRGGRSPNVVMLHSPNGSIPPKMPRSVSLPVNGPAKAIHLLSGVSGWGYQGGGAGSVSLIVRLHYDDGKTEDHPLVNGKHFADYIRRIEVPDSTFAYNLNGRQVRYLTVTPKRDAVIKTLELLKGEDRTAPVVVAVTVETK
jgi:putative membrane-bound dehydrogenase-like protein